MAKEFLRRHGVPFEERSDTGHPEVADEIRRVAGTYVTPVAVHGSRVVIGADEEALAVLAGLPR